MKIFTIVATDDLERDPPGHRVAGSYTSQKQAFDACTSYILERIDRLPGLAWAAAHDENHPEVAKLFSERRKDGRIVIRNGCRAKLRAFVRAELEDQGCYYVYDGNNVWHFDVDENDVEGQLWTTVTWGDSDCEDPEFTTPFPETFVSKEKAIENFYHYALDVKRGYCGDEISEGFKPWVYESLLKDGECHVDLGDGCCVSCVLYSTPAEGIRQ